MRGYTVSVQTPPLRIIHADDPVKEIWSMLNYFESEYNAKHYLEGKFGSSIDELLETAKSLALTMRAAREYYEAAENVTVLTRPLLLFYGMTALSKVLFTATHAKKSPSKRHGLQEVEGWNGVFSEFSVRTLKDGTFPQFHGCFDKQNMDNLEFSLKELFSLIPEAKVGFETVYKEKSRALKILRARDGIQIVDSELDKYVDLESRISEIPGIHERYMKSYQRFENKLILFCRDREPKDPAVRAVSGEEYLILPINKQARNITLPEMSAHFLIMYLLGMLSRYPLKEWGEVIQGEESGEIYIVQKFLEVTRRKFPNLILNELHNRNFIFVSPKIETGSEELNREQLEEIYDYVSRRFANELRGM
jgi:hypothetical protein